MRGALRPFVSGSTLLILLLLTALLLRL